MRNEQFLKVIVLMGDNSQKETIVNEKMFNDGYGLPAGHTQILNKELITLPVYELNDRVTVDVCRGTVFNEDGIGHGGEWITLSGVVTDVYSTIMNNGYVQFDNGDGNTVCLIHSDNGFPSKNIRAENDCIL